MNKEVEKRFNDYPDRVRPKLLDLRTLILHMASDLDLGEVEKSLKWGEPCYSVKTGSPIRIDWKLKSPDNYYLFFNCRTKLVDTFRQLYGNRELYGSTLDFEGNRAIKLKLSEPLPKKVIKNCIKLGLTYKQIRHLPLLGE
ncbi:MAG: hypothetical protein CSB48_12070 [Proteobacteria bacterium]|nr:MAG: hypothetical protein CSB48_12070 [Pseudomonadota bacterium]